MNGKSVVDRGKDNLEPARRPIGAQICKGYYQRSPRFLHSLQLFPVFLQKLELPVNVPWLHGVAVFHFKKAFCNILPVKDRRCK